MTEFILERFNYWLIIILMMAGLYIVFSGTNMIKRLVGLGIFQTSVFLFYITLGKVAGGTAPILVRNWDTLHGDGAHGADDHGGDTHSEGAHAADPELQAPTSNGDVVVAPNSPTASPDGFDPLLALPQAQDADAIANPYGVRAADLQFGPGLADGPAIDGVLYTNPIPSVLILTAIVVAVATLAVGLALTVRVREAYGTIETDEVSQADLDVTAAKGSE